jgi:hypothetical protein
MGETLRLELNAGGHWSGWTASAEREVKLAVSWRKPDLDGTGEGRLDRPLAVYASQ